MTDQTTPESGIDVPVTVTLPIAGTIAEDLLIDRMFIVWCDRSLAGKRGQMGALLQLLRVELPRGK